jgi:hypothetical protein
MQIISRPLLELIRLGADMRPEVGFIGRFVLGETRVPEDAETAFARIQSLHGLVENGDAADEVGRQGFKLLLGRQVIRLMGLEPIAIVVPLQSG